MRLLRRNSVEEHDDGPIEPRSETRFGSTIDLKQVDPRGFELLCAEVFRKCYGVKVDVTQYANDQGKDLIMHASEGDIFVECKHWEGTVGRPVVQKLDSAVSHEGAVRGMIVTTGGYSPGARRYAQECRPPIQLIDLAELQRMASSVGYELTMGGEAGKKEYVCRTASTDDLYAHAKEHLDRKVQSFPEAPSSLMTPGKRSTEYKAYYLVSYRVDADFSTSAIPELRSVHASGRLLVDADGMRFIDDRDLIDDILAHATDKRDIPSYAKVRDPRTVQDAVLKSSTSLVADRFTENVSYRGRNGHFYSKECRPADKDIAITGFTKILVADTELTYTIKGTEYRRSLTDIDGAERWKDDPHDHCAICGKEAKNPMLCTVCGRTVHTSRFKSHGVRCSNCGRTMCTECAGRYRRFLLARPICPGCMSQLNRVPRGFSNGAWRR